MVQSCADPVSSVTNPRSVGMGISPPELSKRDRIRSLQFASEENFSPVAGVGIHGGGRVDVSGAGHAHGENMFPRLPHVLDRRHIPPEGYGSQSRPAPVDVDRVTDEAVHVPADVPSHDL